MSTVKKFSDTELKRQPDAVMDSAQAEHVLIEKSGRPAFVIMSIEEYECLNKALDEDAYWVARAERAEANGWATDEEMLEFLEEAKARGVEVPSHLFEKYRKGA